MTVAEKLDILQKAKILIDSVYYSNNTLEIEKNLSMADTMLIEAMDSLQKQ